MEHILQNTIFNNSVLFTVGLHLHFHGRNLKTSDDLTGS